MFYILIFLSIENWIKKKRVVTLKPILNYTDQVYGLVEIRFGLTCDCFQSSVELKKRVLK